MSRELFHIVAHSCPEVFQHVTQNLSVKFMEKNQRSSSKPRNENQRRDNIATIALLPITDHAPVSYLVQVRRKEKDNYSFLLLLLCSLFLCSHSFLFQLSFHFQALSRSLGQSVSVATVSSSRLCEDLGLQNSVLFDRKSGWKEEEEKEETQQTQHDRYTMMSYLSQLEEMVCVAVVVVVVVALLLLPPFIAILLTLWCCCFFFLLLFFASSSCFFFLMLTAWVGGV